MRLLAVFLLCCLAACAPFPQIDAMGPGTAVSGKGTPWLSVVVGLGYAGCVALTPRFHAYD